MYSSKLIIDYFIFIIYIYDDEMHRQQTKISVYTAFIDEPMTTKYRGFQ